MRVKSYQLFLLVMGIASILFLEERIWAMAGSKDNAGTRAASQEKVYQDYLDFFREVFRTVQKNYYYPVTEENYQKFLNAFDTKIFPQLKHENKSSDFIRWRSAAYLMDHLKDPEDIFSAFMPPQAAKTYETEVLGKRMDLGIEGRPTPVGYEVTRIEPRAHAYELGLRERDVILKIDAMELTGLSEEKIQDLLTPTEGAQVVLTYLDHVRRVETAIQVTCKEYFKQTVFMAPLPAPGIFYIQIQRFNRMTGQDLTRFMSYLLERRATGLIIDLRGNPGGPPLAAREISSFFLSPREEFAYFQRKNKPRAVLDVPQIPERFRFKGEVVILVDKKSGSASELFSGILQGKRRATVIGTNTAGQVFLKSMFYFDDNSMVLLVTARGFHPDGTVFSFNGVTPDLKAENTGMDLVKIATNYLLSRNKP